MVFEKSRQYYLYDRPTDMRKSFNTLGTIVKHEMLLPLTSGAGFIFINRRKTHIKMLMWEGDGFSLYFKRLEQGTYEHPTNLESHVINHEKLMLVLQGIETEKIKKRKRFSL